jgi:putative flippase GtrA
VLGFLTGGNWETWLSFNTTILFITAPYIVLVAAPLYYLLERIGQLRIYWGAMVGGITAVIFDFVENVRWIWNWNNRTVSLYEALQASPAHVEPAAFFLIGALCGVVGWLIAFGPRIARPFSP